MEEEIVVRMKQGDKQAFDMLYEKYKNEAMRTAYFIAVNKMDSEDIVQESFIKCYQHIKELKDNKRFKPWLFHILMRTAWRYCKKQSKEIPKEDIILVKDQLGEASSLEIMMRKESSAAIVKQIGMLPIKQRLVVVLYYYNELPTKEIAKVLGCLEGTVKSRLFTARKTLKEAMIGSYAEEGKAYEKKSETRPENYSSL